MCMYDIVKHQGVTCCMYVCVYIGVDTYDMTDWMCGDGCVYVCVCVCIFLCFPIYRFEKYSHVSSYNHVTYSVIRFIES